MKRYANNKRKQSFVAEFFPDVNQITSRTHTLPTPTSPLPFSNPLERLELAYVGGRRGGAYARGHTRQFIRLEWNRIEINSPPRFRRNVYNLLKRWWRTHPRPTLCLPRTHVLRVLHAPFPGQDAFAGLESIEDRFGRTHSVAGMPAGTLPEKKKGGDTAFVHRGIRAYSGCHSTG